MSVPADKFEQVETLVSALCEGEITPEEAARLEQLTCESDEARRYLLDYVQLHGELYWQFATEARQAASQPAPARPASSLWARLLRASWGFSGTSAALLLLIGGAAAVLVAWIVPWLQGGADLPPGDDAVAAARLNRTFAARWSGPEGNWQDGDALAAGARLELDEGLAEIAFADGARVILEGPTAFRIDGPGDGRLDVGSLHAHAAAEATGFTVRTPAASIVDLGTEFGVAVDAQGTSEVHVLAGSVEIQPDVPATEGGSPHGVQAGQAVRLWVPAAGAALRIDPLEPGSRSFTRRLPSDDKLPGSVAALRAIVAGHPNLLHHYTFEGTTPTERCGDKRGSLDLVRAVMSGGRSGGDLAWHRGVLEPQNTVVQPRRGTISGNRAGVALQSEAVFQPPQQMTVELLACFTGFERTGAEPIGAAVATRADRRDCGFLVVAVDTGQVSCLLDGEAPWCGGRSLVSGEWYYVAATFEAHATETRVNLYLANVSRGEKTLRRVVRGETIPGVAAASRLGIGKGFDDQIAHAYPWAGLLDEVAVFDAALDEGTLQKHLHALVGDLEPNP